ncbi:NAD(P)/FAD-dependent oxidoreductase [Anaerobacillus sp. CMMVII]|uniref:NAD(P)/FAD-dependent oxidoreductase n=1 Tax=Anaerobacillus sp. CMMVII TaxID=2755588 RepID=UPI0021B780E4|nr:NAD(P)/FAD-dependent oxidoreductase [Anaerobacillus sp. CMMVII]
MNNKDYQYLTTKLHEPPVGTLDAEKIKIGIHEVIKTNIVTFKQENVIGIDKNNKKIFLENGTLNYDYLVVAIGAVPETFETPGVKEHAYFIFNFDSIYQLKLQIESMFMTYSSEPDDHLLSFIIVGGGFTGVEFLSELAYSAPYLSKKYGVPLEKIKITCVEAGSTILREFDPEIINYSLYVLEQYGIKILQNQKVVKCEKDGVILNNSTEKLYGNTIVWTVGIKGHHIASEAGFNVVNGRVKIDEFLQVPNEENVFFIGDSSIFTNVHGKEEPPTAQIAIQQGEHCAKNIVALIRGQSLKPFNYVYRGTLMSLGRKNATGIVYNKRVKGRIASFLKKVTEWRYYLKLGGLKLFLKKIFI